MTATAPTRRPGRPSKPAPTIDIPALPEVGNPAWGVPIYGKDLVVGDVIVHLHVDHEQHLIDRFEPYRGELSGVLGDGARTAYAGSWDLAVGEHSIVRIQPRAGAR